MIGLTSDEYSSDDIKFGMVCTPQFADRVDMHTNTTDNQDKDDEFK